MNIQSSKNRIVPSILALSICAMVPLPSLATDFLDPPGNYDYYHWYAQGTNVPTGVTRPSYTTGTSAIKLGDDYFIDGKPIEVKLASTLPSTAFGYRASNKYGVLVYSTGTPKVGCTNSCTASVAASTERCRTFEMSFGVSAEGDMPKVAGVTLNLSGEVGASWTGCIGSTSAWEFTTGYKPSTTYIQAVTGVEWLYARVATTTRYITFRSSIISAATSDAKLIAAHKLCLQQGWAPYDALRTNITYFKQTMAYTGNTCYVPNSSLIVYVYGPHPDGAVFAESYASKRVDPGNFITVYEDAEDVY